jgi:hypothetical protein
MTFAPQAPWEQKSTRPNEQTRRAAPEKRTYGEDAVPSPGHSRANLPADFRQINGWGADLDPANRPGIPRELPSDVKTVRGDVKHWQKPTFKIYMSNEQPGLTPVFGTSCPPSGLSALIKDLAYQFGEGTARHWMTLIMSDRVNTWETALIDMFTGQYAHNKGWSAKRYEGEYDTRNMIFAGVTVIGVVAAGVFVARALRDRD